MNQVRNPGKAPEPKAPLLSYDAALGIVLDSLLPLPPRELPLAQAFGLVLAEPVSARWDLPPADNSAMDGYAFAHASCPPDRRLQVVGFVPAGQPFSGSVPTGGAVKIMTGAPLPPGCDTVVPVEDVDEEAGNIFLREELPLGFHVRRRGEEVKTGDQLLDPGTPLLSGEVGLLAAAGHARVRVHPRPMVAILATGDELVDLGTLPGPGQIVNSNSYLLASRLAEESFDAEILGIARDERQTLREMLQRGLEADLLLTTGGVSVGDRDHVQEVLLELGLQKKFWKVAIKPGKPVLFGLAGQTPVFGLPGNPSASAVTFELFVRPALRRLAGHTAAGPARFPAILENRVKGGGKRQQFLWGRLEGRSDGLFFAPAGKQGSGQNLGLRYANALLPVAAGSQDLAAGASVEVLLVRMPA